MMSEVVPTTTQPVKSEQGKHDQVQNENVEDRIIKKETRWQRFLSPFNRCFKNTTDCLNFWCCKNECYNFCCNSKYYDEEEEPNNGDEVVLTAINRQEETIGTYRSNATSEIESYIDSTAGEGYSHQCHTFFPVTATNFELNNIALIAEKTGAIMQPDSKPDEDDKDHSLQGKDHLEENTHAMTPLGDHSGNQAGGHTGSHDGGHSGKQDGGYTGSHDGGHAGSHDGGHKGNHDVGHKESHDGGHKGSHDGGHTGSHDGGHTGSHDHPAHHIGGHTESHGGGHHHTVEVHSGNHSGGYSGDNYCGGGDTGGGGDAVGSVDVGWGGDCGDGGGDY